MVFRKKIQFWLWTAFLVKIPNVRVEKKSEKAWKQQNYNWLNLVEKHWKKICSRARPKNLKRKERKIHIFFYRFSNWKNALGMKNTENFCHPVVEHNCSQTTFFLSHQISMHIAQCLKITKNVSFYFFAPKIPKMNHFWRNLILLQINFLWKGFASNFWVIFKHWEILEFMQQNFLKGA